MFALSKYYIIEYKLHKTYANHNQHQCHSEKITTIILLYDLLALSTVYKQESHSGNIQWSMVILCVVKVTSIGSGMF